MATIAELVRQGQGAGRGEDPGLPATPTAPATAGKGGAESGSPTLDFIKKYGPLAALAIPAIVLARGAGGKTVLTEARQAVGNPLFERLVRSPHTYVFERPTAREFDKITQGTSRIAAVQSEPMRDITEPGLLSWLSSEFKGRPMPETISRIMSTPEGGAAATSHETAHALGMERLRQKALGERAPDMYHELAKMHHIGGFHSDIASDPRTQQMVVESLKRWPKLADFWGQYRQLSDPHTAYGELINEAWAQRQAARMGQPRLTAAEQPWFGRRNRIEAEGGMLQYPGEITALRQTGRLPEATSRGVAGRPLMHGYAELQKALEQHGPNPTPEAREEIYNSLRDWVRFFLSAE